jgi:peptidoglycan/xylan/chitin deacetylase (PgdA/CDA1 family)
VVAGAGWSDAPFTDLSDAELGSEVGRANALLEELTKQAVHHVGPPGGRYDERVAARLGALGLQVWVWTAHPTDDATGAGALDVLTPGAALRLHDEDDPEGVARAALRALLEGARRSGYAFVGIDHGEPAEPGEGR